MTPMPAARSFSMLACLVGGALIAALAASPVRAEVLPLPVPAEALLQPIAAACPDCVHRGFMPCGSADVQYGRGFAATAMLGEPPRAYLLAQTPVRAEALRLVKSGERAAAIEALQQRFAEARLVVVQDGWRTVRLLAPDATPRVAADPAQQACFRDSSRSLGCCLGDGGAAANCLPKADPPSVRLTFADPASGERLELRYPIGKGELSLRRHAAGRTILYWCQAWAPARLVGAR